MLKSLGRGGQFGDLDMMLKNMEGRTTMIKCSGLVAATNRMNVGTQQIERRRICSQHAEQAMRRIERSCHVRSGYTGIHANSYRGQA